jgi:cell division protein FtsB
MDSARTMAARRSATVRWDRVGRVALLLLLGVVLLLYVNPAVNYVKTWQTANAKRGEVNRLQAQNKRLRARKAAMKQPATLEHEARALGMVRPGERSYVIRGLPRAPIGP